MYAFCTYLINFTLLIFTFQMDFYIFSTYLFIFTFQIDKLTTEQHVLLVKLYYECVNASEAARQVVTKFGREAPNHSTVL